MTLELVSATRGFVVATRVLVRTTLEFVGAARDSVRATRRIRSVLQASGNAPRAPEALAEWWPRFERQVGENGTGLWPTEKELRDAAMATNKATPKDPKHDEEFDWYEVMGKRMAEGKDVGENYLYGREAVELIRRKLVDEDTMRRYRSAAFFARKEIQTEASALEWESEAKARHQAAKDIYRDQVRKQFNTSLPDLTSPAKDFSI